MPGAPPPYSVPPAAPGVGAGPQPIFYTNGGQMPNGTTVTVAYRYNAGYAMPPNQGAPAGYSMTPVDSQASFAPGDELPMQPGPSTQDYPPPPPYISLAPGPMPPKCGQPAQAAPK